MCRDTERLTLLTDVIISAIRSCYLPYLPHTPGHLQFFFLSWWSNPHPRAPGQPHVLIFWVYLFKIDIDIRTIAKRNVFITFVSLFSRRITSFL